MDYQDHVTRLRADEPELAGQLAAFTNRRHVLEWMDEKGLSLQDVDVVAQDEFSHDFVFRCRNEGKYLIFGMS